MCRRKDWVRFKRELIDDFFRKAKRFSAADWGYVYHRLLGVRGLLADLNGVQEFMQSKKRKAVQASKLVRLT